jgi:hypothetical protein
MRAFAVGAGQTPDFGRSPRAVPLGSLDIFAGPVTPRDLVTWASLSRGPPRATTRERRTRRMALRAAQNVAENGSAPLTPLATSRFEGNCLGRFL